VLRLKHAYTHFKITLHVFECELVAGKPKALDVAALRWARPSELGKFAMGKTDREIARFLEQEPRAGGEGGKT
jgi:A/G-specific adenine glycosylase